MQGELIAVSIISGIFGILSILMLQRNWMQKKEMDWKYTIKRYKLGKQYKIAESQLPPAPTKSTIEKVKGIDTDKIGNILDMIQGKDYDQIDEDEDEDFLDTIIDIAKNNPELTQQFLGKLGKSGGASKPQEPTYIGD